MQIEVEKDRLKSQLVDLHSFFQKRYFPGKSKEQTVVAQSAVEAEFIDLASTIKEVVWLQKFSCALFKLTRILRINVRVDTLGYTANAENAIVSARTKHIDIKIQFNTDNIHMKLVNLKHVSTTDMMTDILAIPCKPFI